MSLKINPVNLAFDITNLKNNIKRNKLLSEEKMHFENKNNEEAKQNNDKNAEEIHHCNYSDGKGKKSDGTDEKESNKYYINTLQYQDGTNISTLKLINRNLEKELFNKKTEIRMLQKNFKEKIALIELENKKLVDSLESKYSKYILSINEATETRIKEILAQYKNNTYLMEKEHKNLINEMREIRSSHISISQHKEKINEITTIWENKYENLKKEYDMKYRELSQNMSQTINANLSLIKCNNDINSDSPQDIIKMIKTIKLEHQIGYTNYILDYIWKYNQSFNQVQSDKKDSLNILKMFTIKKFNDIMKIKDTAEKYSKQKNIEEKTNINENKRHDLVNYDTSDLQISNSINHITNSNKDYNDNTQYENKVKDVFNSEFESLNFNENNISNRVIQVFPLPDMIK